MYKSPIELLVTDIQDQIVKQQDEEVYKAVLHYVPNVDKEELIRALRYDRQQYEKGYLDGKADAVVHGRWVGTQYDGYADGCPVYDLWECSECREEYESEGDPPNYRYCPNCGAKMDGGRDDHESV